MSARSGFTFLGVALAVLLSGCSAPPPKSDDQAAADQTLDSARNTAVVFLDALRNQDGSSAFSLLSKDYRERLSEEERNAKKMQVAVVEGQPVAEWSRNSGVLSDNKEQATFEDFVQLKSGQRHGYRMMLVKENGVWKVDLFTVKK